MRCLCIHYMPICLGSWQRNKAAFAERCLDFTTSIAVIALFVHCLLVGHFDISEGRIGSSCWQESRGCTNKINFWALFFQMTILMGNWCQIGQSDTEFLKPFGGFTWSDGLEHSFCSQTAAWVTHYFFKSNCH